MKLPRYTGLIVFLWVSVLAFAAYAFLANPFQVSDDLALNQWSLKDFLITKEPKKPATTIKDTVIAIAAPEPKPRDVDSSKQRILLAGDSMAECLLYGLREYAKHNGHKISEAAWAGSSTIKWAKSDSLEVAIKRFKPTLVLFCLGANELTIPNIWNREKYLKTIITKLDTVNYLWVSPPNWTEDTGLTEMISANVPQAQLFISKDLKLERRGDGAHPTIPAAKVWADSVAKWIVEKSAFPILLAKAPRSKVNEHDNTKVSIGMSSASALPAKVVVKASGRKA